MARNGSGTYSAIINSWNPAVAGTPIDEDDWNAQLADYVTAFTDSLSRTAQGGMLADLGVDANSVLFTEISAPSSPAANSIKVYCVDVTGTSKLAYKDSAGAVSVLGAGTGDVVGPASSTDNAVVRFDSTTGKLIQNSAVTIADTTGLIAGSRFANAGLVIEDTDASHLLTITPGSNLSANRVFTLTTGDAARTLDISAGSVTITAAGAALTAGADAAAQRATLTALSYSTTALITVGYTLTPNNIGTVSSGTTTLAAATGNYQYLTNNGAFTLAAPAADCAIDLLVTNGASAGSITFSGFTVGSSTGSSLTTTNTNKFIISVRRINSVATYSIYALQ